MIRAVLMRSAKWCGGYAADGTQALTGLFFPATDTGVARAEAHRQALVDAEAETDVSEPLELPAVPAASAGEAGDSPAAVSDSPTTPAAGRPLSAVDIVATAIQESLEQLVEVDPPHSRETYELVAQDVVDELLTRATELTEPQK